LESVPTRTDKSRLKENGLLFILRTGKQYAEANTNKENTTPHHRANGGNILGQISQSNRPTFGLSLRAKAKREN